MQSSKLENTIIYLIGVPAVGKYTAAKEIGRLTGATVIDNQLINTPVFSVIGYDGKDSFTLPDEAWFHIETIQRAVLAVIRDLCPREQSFIFTSVLDADQPCDRAWYRRIERVASHRQARFFPVWLTCDENTIRSRKNTAERKMRFKDTDLSTIKWWLEEFEVLKINYPYALTLDTSRAEPHEVATQILSHVAS